VRNSMKASAPAKAAIALERDDEPDA
jgi:hypothetical protein